MKYIIIILLLTSCVSSKKVHKYLDKHPEEAAQFCAEAFPVKDTVIVRDSIRFDTLYLETEPEIIRDSFWLKGDTIIRQVTKNCPPHQVVTKTVTKDSLIIRRDRAYETVQANEITRLLKEMQKKNGEIVELEGKLKAKTKKMWLFLFIAIGLGIWNFRKQILSLLARLIVPVKIPPI